MKQIALINILMFLFWASFANDKNDIKIHVGQLDDLIVKTRYEAADSLAYSLIKKSENRDNWGTVIQYANALCRSFSTRKQIDSVYKYAQLSASAATKANDHTALAYNFLNQAILQDILQNPNQVVKNCQKALEFPLEDTRLLSLIYNSLFMANSEIDNVPEMEKYAEMSLEYGQKANNPYLIANGYFNRSVAFEYKYRSEHKEEDKIKSRAALEEIKKTYDKYPDKVTERLYLLAAINIASHNLLYYANNPKFEAETEANVNLVLEKVDHLKGHNIDIKASAYGILSEIKLSKKDLSGAEHYLQLAYELLKGSDAQFYHLGAALKGLSKVSELKGDYKTALNYQQLFAENLSKAHLKEREDEVKKASIQLETERKNQEIVFLQDKAKSDYWIKILLILLIIAFAIGLIYTWRSGKFKSMYLKATELKLESEREASALQLRLQEEEQQKLIANQKLLEMQQLQLQKEVTVKALQIEHKDEILKEVKDHIEGGNLLNVNKILKEDEIVSQEFDLIKKQTTEIHPMFYKLLNEKANQKLTSQDLSYCSYIYLNMSTKQLANIFSVEPKSVRMSKYRLKQKLQLGKDEDLESFIKSII